MNILYVGELNQGGTCLSRLEALNNIQSDIFILDTNALFQWDKMNRLNRFFERYTLLGKKIRRANKELLHEVEKNEIEVLWLDTAYWIYQETLEILHKRGVFLINYTTDAFYNLWVDEAAVYMFVI